MYITVIQSKTVTVYLINNYSIKQIQKSIFHNSRLRLNKCTLYTGQNNDRRTLKAHSDIIESL